MKRKPDFNIICAHCKIIFVVKRKSYLDNIRDDSNHKFYCSKECYLAARKTGHNINCATCGKEVYKPKNELDGGEKFCSQSCAAIFNNKKRIENGYETTKGKTKKLNCSKCGIELQAPVNSPISTILCDNCRNSNLELKCWLCGITIFGSRGIKYCNDCRDISRTPKIQASIKNRINNGTFFSRAIKCEFDFNGDIIKCDSKLEYVCLYYFTTTMNIKFIRRSDLVLDYVFNGKNKKYFPDFEIWLEDGTKYIVECKGVVGKKLSDKWNDYNEKSIIKKNLLEEWCATNNYSSFWFDQQLHNKLYQQLREKIPV
jgi:hypothetical protein